MSVVMLSNGLVNCRGEVKDLKERIKSLGLELRDSQVSLVNIYLNQHISVHQTMYWQAQVRGLRNASTNPSLDEYLISESRLRCTLEDAQTRIAVLERTLAEVCFNGLFRMENLLTFCTTTGAIPKRFPHELPTPSGKRSKNLHRASRKALSQRGETAADYAAERGLFSLDLFILFHSFP